MEKLIRKESVLEVAKGFTFTDKVEEKMYMDFLEYCLDNATDNSEPLTNADRIRSMTDEELAKFLSCDCEYVINCKTCKEPVNEYGSCSGLCRYEYLRWLKSKAGCE